MFGSSLMWKHQINTWKRKYTQFNTGLNHNLSQCTSSVSPGFKLSSLTVWSITFLTDKDLRKAFNLSVQTVISDEIIYLCYIMKESDCKENKTRKKYWVENGNNPFIKKSCGKKAFYVNEKKNCEKNWTLISICVNSVS